MNKITARHFLLLATVLCAIGVFVSLRPNSDTGAGSSSSSSSSSGLEQQQPAVTIAHTKIAQKAGATLDTKKHGWGFVRNKLHEIPEISREQEKMLTKYPVIYTLPSKKKEISLTFDLGYENGYTPQILDTLKAHKVSATFFVTGYWLRKNQELCKRMMAEGHIVGNHTVDHPSLAEVSQARFTRELQGVESLILKTAGKMPAQKFLRPPMGEYSERSLEWARSMGYTTVFWSVALKDWEPLPNPQFVVNSVMANIHPGAVVLLHGISRESSGGLDELLDELSTEGYKVVPIKEVRL